MATTVTIDGSPVAVPTTILPVRAITCVWKGVPSFTFQVRGGALPTGADPYLGLDVVVAIDGTDVFAGDVVRFIGHVGCSIARGAAHAA